MQKEDSYVFAVSREPMVDASGEDDQIILHQPNAYPVITLASNIEEAFSVSDPADLLILVQMLVEEHLHLLLVYRPHLLGGYRDLISVLVAPLLCECVH